MRARSSSINDVTSRSYKSPTSSYRCSATPVKIEIESIHLNLFTGVQLVFVTLPACKLQEQFTSRKSLVSFEDKLLPALFKEKNVSSLSEEEVEELLQDGIRRQPRNV